MSKRKPCESCPFRVESKLAYDHDALEAITDGHQPNCHKIVGMDALFNKASLSSHCMGFESYNSGVFGFVLPNKE